VPLLIATRLANLAQRSGETPWLRHVTSWSARAVLDLDPRPLNERDTASEIASRLHEAGVLRFPFTAEGLCALANHLAYGTSPPAPEPTLRRWHEVEPYLHRWAALAGCVPDPTWVQLDAFRRTFDELRQALPNAGYMQRLIEWLRHIGEDATSADGRRLAISENRVLALLRELRMQEKAPPGDVSATERRARLLIYQQLAAATPESRPMGQRLVMRLAFHRAVLEPARADELLSGFIGTPDEPEMRRTLESHCRSLPHGISSTAWRTLAERMSDAPSGPVPLRELAGFASPRRDFPIVAVTVASLGVSWGLVALLPDARGVIVVCVGALGLAGIAIADILQRRSLVAPAGPDKETETGRPLVRPEPLHVPTSPPALPPTSPPVSASPPAMPPKPPRVSASPPAVPTKSPRASALLAGVPPASPPTIASPPTAPRTPGTLQTSEQAASTDDKGTTFSRRDTLFGQVLADRYRVLDLIGMGGMGKVYLAEHVALGKRVAVKVLNLAYTHRPDQVKRFLREAQAASTIGHENVIDITDFGEMANGSVFFAMEHLQGDDLGKLLKKHGALIWPRARRILLQICRALQAAHARGIIHRDMKPENCFIIHRNGMRDFVKVTDFGIAKFLEENRQVPDTITQPGTLIGAPEYMAPEQVQGEAADVRMDIYAVGCIMYQLLTGQVPFSSNSVFGVLSLQVNVKPVPPRQLAPEADIPPEVEAIILKAMEKDRNQRYQSMADLIEAIVSAPRGAWSGGRVD
jgi:hypothetical protein